MNEVRTFRAASMQEALNIVRQEMGSDAVILHTRQIRQRRILPWRKAKEDVEITAGLGINIRPPATASRSTNRVERSTTTRKPPPLSQLAAVTTNSAQQTPPRTDQAQSLQQSSVTALDLPNSFGRAGSRSTYGSDLDQGVELSLSSSRTATATTHHDFSGQGNIGSMTGGGAGFPRTAPVPDSVATASEPGSLSDPNLFFASQLDSIQKMVETLGRARQVGGADEIPNELFHLYTELIDADVEDDLSRDLIAALRQNCSPTQLSDAASAKVLLTSMVESEIRCANPITPTPGHRKVVALVGPTGVGKTTTIAKLAANFRLRDGIKMGLVTVDTYRVAAVEQLRTYAEIIDLPMKVVTSSLDMRRALDELAGMDLVLIDTAGRSPRDEMQIQELKTLLAEADVDEVHLVLSLTSSVRSLQATAEKFAAAKTTSIILTKLDEAAGMGSLLSVARKVGLPISYLTTGQDVPDDIEPANACRISRLVLGQDRLFD